MMLSTYKYCFKIVRRWHIDLLQTCSSENCAIDIYIDFTFDRRAVSTVILQQYSYCAIALDEYYLSITGQIFKLRSITIHKFGHTYCIIIVRHNKSVNYDAPKKRDREKINIIIIVY